MASKYKGFLAVIVSAVIFGGMPLLVKTIYANGGNPVSLVLYRFVIAIPVLYIAVKANKNISFSITKEELKKIIVVAIIGYSGTGLLLFLSYNYIPSGMATTIHFVYPIFVILGCILFYKEKLDYVKVISVLLCTIGVVLFYNGESAGSIMGIVIAFSSGITYSFYIIFIDKSGLKSMHPMKLTFYLCLIASPVIFIWSIVTGTFTTNITPLGWFLTSILSIAVSIGAVGLFQVGISIIGPQSTAILSTFEPITSVIIGILVFNEVFDLKVLGGSVLILISAILLAVFDKESKIEECKKVYET